MTAHPRTAHPRTPADQPDPDKTSGRSPARPGAAHRIVRAGRTLISETAHAQLRGLAATEIAALYAARSHNQHPDVIYHDVYHQMRYFDEEALLRWHHTHRLGHSSHGADPPPRTQPNTRPSPHPSHTERRRG